jgi:benzoyl-CoA 2,3-dioxygenase component B
MSVTASDVLTEVPESIRGDAFVEVRSDASIPNNVDLESDKQLQRALETWHPNYLNWWQEMGPDGFQNAEVYLRTAVGVDPTGWAKFGYVKMPDYRWGILLAPKVEGRTIPCGKHKGEPAWQEVPGEYRALLKRLIVVQGDTEPASVEQQRYLGKTAPSLYDMRNLFQVNVEEGRHLWAMVYLLVKYFGKDGREEAQAPCSNVAAARPTTRASSAPSTSARRTGCRSSCSPTSQTATARCSSRRWPRADSIPCRAPADSC